MKKLKVYATGTYKPMCHFPLQFSGFLVKQRQRIYKCILLLLLSGFSGTAVMANTYYLTAAGAANAQVPASWNTIAAGGGTAASNFTTNGDVFIIPAAINGIVSANWVFGESGSNGANLSLTVNGSLTINAGIVMTLAQKNSFNSTMTIANGGSLIFLGTGATSQLVGTKAGNANGSNTFSLANGATLKTANANGISGTGCSINPSLITVSLGTAANYEMNGDNQNISGLPATVNNLTIAGTGTKTMQANCAVTGMLSVNGTAVLDADGAANNLSFVLKSTATGTAYVAAGNAAGGYISGNVTVERYIADAGHRAWHLLSVPVTGTQTIYNAWQEAGVNVASKGTIISSNLYSGSNGFDMVSNSASILTHNQGGVNGPSWNYALGNTNTTQLSSYPGYMLFVRGDRNYTPTLPNSTATSATVLSTTGNLRQGTQSPVIVSATGTGRTLVGNPFASPVDFETIYTTANLDQNFYIWDPAMTGTNGVGAFRLVERIGVNDYEATPSISVGADNSLRYIHSGQAFFLKATGSNASVVFTEASKAVNTGAVNPIVNPAASQQLLINLISRNTATAPVLLDGSRIRFDDSYNANTSDDVQKMGNFAENIAVYQEGKKFIITKRPLVHSNDTIFLRISNLQTKDYRISLVPFHFDQPGVTAFIEDNYTNKRIALDPAKATTDLDFSVTDDAASAKADRFSIVFSYSKPVASNITSISAASNNGKVTVKWETTNQQDMQLYEVERAADGLHFEKLATQMATVANGTTAAYSWQDMNPVNGNNYYRIRSLAQNSTANYTAVAMVHFTWQAPAMTVYPNPVTNQVCNIRFSSLPEGIYQLRISNMLGALLQSETWQHSGGDAAQSFRLNDNISPGVYQLEISGVNGTQMTMKIRVANK